jgi:hypothetical protein
MSFHQTERRTCNFQVHEPEEWFSFEEAFGDPKKYSGQFNEDTMHDTSQNFIVDEGLVGTPKKEIHADHGHFFERITPMPTHQVEQIGHQKEEGAALICRRQANNKRRRILKVITMCAGSAAIEDESDEELSHDVALGQPPSRCRSLNTQRMSSNTLVSKVKSRHSSSSITKKTASKTAALTLQSYDYLNEEHGDDSSFRRRCNPLAPIISREGYVDLRNMNHDDKTWYMVPGNHHAAPYNGVMTTVFFDIARQPLESSTIPESDLSS